jgi:branched-chain amino acid transport system substrate-binding protein
MSEKKLPTTYIIAAIIVVVIIIVGLYAFFGWKAAPKVEQVNIAVFMPLSGAQSVYGHDILQGVQFAVDEINAQGGIKSLGGAKINLIVVDITSDATQAVSIVEDALTRYDLTAAVGPGLSYLMIAVQPVFIKHRVPAVTGAISVDILKNNPKGEPWVFMMGPNSSLFGRTSGDFLKYLSDVEGIEAKIAVVHGNTEYEVTTAEAAKDRFESLGFEVVLFEEYATPLVDATPLVQKIGASGATVVYPVSYLTDAQLIIKTMKVQNVRAIVIGGGAGYLYPAFYEALGDDVAYVFSVSQWNYDLWPSSKVEEYKEKFGVMFPQEQVGVNYAGVWVLKEAIEIAASTDPEKVAEVLREIDITTGPAGRPGYYGVKFNDMGWNTRAVAVMVEWLPGGDLVTVYPSEVATHEIVFP